MNDIHDCQDCGEKAYMNNTEHCIVCSSWFCRACDYKNGKITQDNDDNNYYICNKCLIQGLNYINENNEDEAIFTKEEWLRVVKEI